MPGLPPCYPRGSRIDDGGDLVVRGCSVADLCAEFGTPVYVYDEADLRGRTREYRTEFEGRHRDSEVLFASKAFPCTAAYRLFAEEGLSCDVAYRVVSVKRDAVVHVAVDGGMGDNLEPSLYGTAFEARCSAVESSRSTARWSASTASQATCWCTAPSCRRRGPATCS